MRSFIVVLMLALAGCNNSSTSSPDEALVAQVQALQNQVNTLSGQVKQLQLIGRPVGAPIAKPDQVVMFRAMGEPTLAPAAVTVAAVSFGPCPDMGVKIGDTNAPQDQYSGSLSAAYQAFKSCMGYLYEVSTLNGNIKPANRIFWDGPNCTGNLLEWEAGGAGYNTQALKDGVVFLNPADDSTQLMVVAGQTPKPILIQSVMLDVNHICQSDIETQPMYLVSPHNQTVTGVAIGTVGSYTLASP